MTTPVIGPRGVLLHVGPHKTGTSALQGSFARSHEALAQHGVTVAGSPVEQAHAARAVTGVSSTRGIRRSSITYWDDMVATTRESSDRVLISSEYFDVAEGAVIDKMAAELGPDRVHVVVTAVPLASLMPSDWQQWIRSRHTGSFDEWLQSRFDAHESGEPTLFWRRYRIDDQLQRWAKVIGSDRVHLVIGDKNRKQQLFESFEELLGVPPQTLVPHAANTNRSLRWGEVEFMRHINKHAEGLGWNDTTHARFLRMGASRGLLSRTEIGADEPAIRLPQWARPQVEQIQRLEVERIRAMDIHIMGDLDSLAPSLVSDAPDLEPVAAVHIDAAARAVIWTAMAGGAGILREKHVEQADLAKYPGLSSATSTMLAEELHSRAREGRPYPGLGTVPAGALVTELMRRVKAKLRRPLPGR